MSIFQRIKAWFTSGEGVPKAIPPQYPRDSLSTIVRYGGHLQIDTPAKKKNVRRLTDNQTKAIRELQPYSAIELLDETGAGDLERMDSSAYTIANKAFGKGNFYVTATTKGVVFIYRKA